MSDPVRQRPLLTREDVRTEAGHILGIICASHRHEQRPAFERAWLLLWQLLREVKAAELPPFDSAPGPWMWLHDGDGSADSTARLVAGDFLLESFPPGIARLALDLPIILNWAGVPIPWVQRSYSGMAGRDQERAMEAAERRREQAELFRRQSEEGRQISEGIRERHEGFRDDTEHDREAAEVTRATAEQMRDTQEAARELAEVARQATEAMRTAANDARDVTGEVREMLKTVQALAQRLRIATENQEAMLAAWEKQTKR